MPRFLTDDQLVAELNALGVHFLTGGDGARLTPSATPSELLVGLAQSRDARVRSAIIPLLLIRPSLAGYGLKAIEQLRESDQNTLMLFYTAAMLLQAKHQAELKALLGLYEPLPDLFSRRLNLTCSDNIDQQLHQLSERHKTLTHCCVNWLGVYAHAAERSMKRLESEAAWQEPLV